MNEFVITIINVFAGLGLLVAAGMCCYSAIVDSASETKPFYWGGAIMIGITEIFRFMAGQAFTVPTYPNAITVMAVVSVMIAAYMVTQKKCV